MRARRGQAAIEFLVLLGFMTLVFATFFVVVQQRTSSAREQAAQAELEEVARLVEQEVTMAHKVLPGYERVFELPLLVGEQDYNVTLYPAGAPSEVVVRAGELEHVLFLQVNLTNGSTAAPGHNKVTKDRAGNVSLSPTNASTGGLSCTPPTCDDANPCTEDRCVAGTCTRKSLDDGTLCGTGPIAPECRAGACVQCDADGDGRKAVACGGTDCFDTDASLPLASEICGNARDDTCDGAVDEGCLVDAITLAPACGGASSNDPLVANASTSLAGTVAYAYDWRVNGTSIMALNLLFDVNDSAGAGRTRDYGPRAANGTLTNGASWSASGGRTGTGAIALDGHNDFVDLADNSLVSVQDDFTIEIWALPTATRAVTAQASAGVSGTSGQRYAIYPQHGGGSGSAGAGVSIGTNGVSVFEHASGHLPSTLVHDATLSGWTHVVVAYRARVPTLYLDGVAVRTGVAGATAHVYPGQDIGGVGNPYGNFSGRLDSVRIYRRALTAEQVGYLFLTGANVTANRETSMSETWSVCAVANNKTSHGARVCSASLALTSAASACACPLSAPTNLQAIVGETSASLTWTPGTGSPLAGADLRQQLLRVGTSESDVRNGCPGYPAGSCVAVLSLPSSTSSHALSGLARGTRYYARIVNIQRDLGCYLDQVVSFQTSACTPGAACPLPAGGTYNSTCGCNCAATQCSIGGACQNAGSLNPGNSCLYCDPGFSKTSWRQRANGQSCEDGQFCTGNDQCWFGNCQAGTGTVCSGSTATCDEANNRCVGCLDPADCGPTQYFCSARSRWVTDHWEYLPQIWFTGNTCTSNVCGVNGPFTLRSCGSTWYTDFAQAMSHCADDTDPSTVPSCV